MAKWCWIGREPGEKGNFDFFSAVTVPYPEFSVEIFPRKLCFGASGWCFKDCIHVTLTGLHTLCMKKRALYA